MKITTNIFLLLTGLLFSQVSLFCQNYIEEIIKIDNSIVLSTNTGNFIKIQSLSNNLVRIRFEDRNQFSQSLMERYEIVNKKWPDTAVGIDESENDIILKFGESKLLVTKNTGTIDIENSNGEKRLIALRFLDESTNNQTFAKCQEHFSKQFPSKKLIDNIVGDEGFERKIIDETFSLPTGAFGFSVNINPDDRFYGFGSAMRGQIQHRGSALKIWAEYQKSEIPVPFVMNTGGWAIFCNTTFVNYWDIDQLEKDKMVVWGPEGNADIFIILHDNMEEMLSTYTEITGKPYLYPRWAYGLSFGSNIMEDQFDILDNATRFRSEGIPCDMYEIEPQWMAQNYDFSTKKKWDYNKFRPFWPEFKLGGWNHDELSPEELLKEHLFVKRLENIGFKMSLWLCIDTDLSVQEEDNILAREGKALSGKEHWFDHLTQFIDDGIKGFKLDPGRTLNEHPNRVYHNGLTDREMHNMQQVLLQKQMKLTYQNHTGERSYHHYCGGYAGSQHWGTMTSGDNGGGELAMHDMLNLSMSGFANTSCDVFERVYPMSEGIHFGFLQPWVLINSWAEIFHPWYFTPTEKKMVKDYAVLRYSLIPYIYSHALNASLSGMPIVRAMPLAFPNDSRLENNINQYMFGEFFLVGAFTSQIILPEGIWIDYWTGEKYHGNSTLNVEIPIDKGGPLFVKAGAIIPMQTKSQFIPDLPQDTLILQIYPDYKKESSFTILEDDGISYGYESGKYSSTDILCTPGNKEIHIQILPSTGNYIGEKTERTIVFEVSMDQPRSVWLNNIKLKKSDYKYNSITSKIELICIHNVNKTTDLKFKLK